MKAKELSHKIRIIRGARYAWLAASLLLVQQAVVAQLDQPALKGFLQRIVKDKAGSFDIAYISPENGKDVFEVEQGNGKVVLRGSNGVSVGSALNYYLKNYCHVLITWNGSPPDVPAVLPRVSRKVHKVTPYTCRYYLNYCTFQYSMAWWDWDRWQREIDWMALNGINMPLALTGEEAIWQEVYRAMGFTDTELDKFFTGPAYFSWLWMGNIDAWGGPLPAHWKESHRLLQKKILQAERGFGMKPVLPAFTGHVPPSFKDRFPSARVKKTNWDAGFPDVYILDPSDPMFEVIGRKFIEVQTREFGTDHLYSADTFNENVPPTSDSTYLDGMSKKVFASMAAADPAAVWVMQGWMFHYNAAYWKPTQIQALLKAVPDDHMILLDLYSESHPVWNRTGAYYGKPWVWNMLHDFGGNISLWGRMRHVAEDPAKALHDPAAGRMVGIGLTPEGIEQNPALYQLMLENVWQDEPVKVVDWLDAYVRERYSDGGASGQAAWRSVREAWLLLDSSVYDGGLGEGGPESIIQARPTFEKAIDRVLTKLDYDPAKLFEAWKLFEQAAPYLGKSDGFRYDLADITRQVLANYASPLQQNIVMAWQAKDTAAFHRYSRKFLALMDDMDRLLATRRDFLLGKWIHDARACGITPGEKDLYEKNARDLVTLWGDKESGLREYSCRQWSGLIKGFYKPRWELFFRYLDNALAAGHEVDMAAFDKAVKDWEWHWVNSHDAYPDRTSGETVTVATEMYRKYGGSVRASVYGLSAAVGNDHIFRAAPAVRAAIDFDDQGFLVHGRRTFIVSAGIEYARVPHELWRDRLLRLKRAGFNCIEIYTFWNFHEPREGQFEFSGDHDLEAFLRLAGELGLYAIVRVGPYYCAEWDNGGYPLWLRFKDGLRVGEDNAEFEKYADRYFDRLLPIVCRQQVHHGGPVIMVQLENEHNLGWGTAMPNGYFRHLREKAVSLGLEVPYFFSGLHHGSDPAGEEVQGAMRPEAEVGFGGDAVGGAVVAARGAGDAMGAAGGAGEGAAGWGDDARLDDPDRPNPWMSTEFWSVWYDGYGSTPKDSAIYDRRTWTILAHGGNGYNYYMAHGGSNFGYTNNDEDAASYDYGAAVGQAGDLRPVYYAFKRAAFFAHSFESILEHSVDGTEAWRKHDQDSLVRVTARHSVEGDLVFLDNRSERPVSTTWTADGYEPMNISLAVHEIFPLVHHFSVMPGIRIEWAPARILAVTGKGHVRTIIADGDAGQPVRLYFTTDGTAAVINSGREDRSSLSVRGSRVSLLAFCPGELQVPSVYSFRVRADTVRILIMNRGLADRTWLPEVDGQGYIVCGPAYMGDMRVKGDAFSVLTERKATAEADRPMWLYRASGKEILLRPSSGVGLGAGAGAESMKDGGHFGYVTDSGAERAVALGPWQQRMADDPARTGYDDRDWTASERPLPMGADGDTTADAWYKTIVHIDTGGSYTLQAGGGDRATVFVDGRVAGSGNLHQGELPLQMPGGDHVLAIFTAEDGRDKLAGFMGDMSEVDNKGLIGPIVLERGGSTRHELGGWRYLPSSAADTAAGTVLPSDRDERWKPYTIGQDVFDHREGFAWMRTVLPDPPAGARKGVLYFRSVDENATVFLNGRRLARHEGWNIPFSVTLEDLDTMQRPLVLTILIENYSNEGGIDRPVQVNYLTDAKELTGWKMHGGVADPQTIHDWAIMASGVGNGRDSTVAGAVKSRDTASTGVVAAPCYYRTLFRVPAYQGAGLYPIWRVMTTGLGHGSVWVNGYNLGRYPEKIPAPGLYIPECWIRAGENELIIYDEDGRRPDAVTIQPEIAAGRYLTEYTGSSVQDVLSYVNPMIGTTKSDVYTRWGNEGGTYPGAVAPWGYMQMTPETRPGGGYDYGDTAIGWFSCVGHMSGYPGGSGGQIKIMPVSVGGGGRMPGPRAFLHRDEEARAGYYRVMFADDGTVVEATAGARTGWLRVTFPPGVKPVLFVGGMGRMKRLSARAVEGEGPPTVVHFDQDIEDIQVVEGGQVFSFGLVAGKATAVVFSISVSAVGTASAERNLRTEAAPEGFDGVKKRTQAEWRKQLSVITVEDSREGAKTIFYTALYHALLLPWIISDAEGRYRGSDGLIHAASGKNEYGGFSPWDTFRSLHPLLTLLFPARQQDMLLSMLDIYRQTGYLPTGPMTGNHAVPIFVDSWLKGIRGFNPAEAYAAMRKGVKEAPYQPADREIYRRVGYVPLTYPESVTRTVEYAYDDWAVGRFAEQVLHVDGGEGGYSYRNLFDPGELLLLPRDGTTIMRHPGTSGYKEGDAWVYTYFTPQHPRDLVNLLGGDEAFTARLDSALRTQTILFDNETVFHIPYLFNDAGYPGKTQEWVSRLRDGRYAATPGGLPGNDDLGACSSWYVFSALGFFPVCPGRPEYDLGTPLFRSATLHLANGRVFTVKADGAGRPYVHGLALNGTRYNRLTLSHASILQGGELVAQMSDIPAGGHRAERDERGVDNVTVSKDKVFPNELLQVRFILRNKGSLGTRIVVLKVNGHEYARKNCLIGQGDSVVDSIGCRLYAYGKARLEIGDVPVREEVEIIGEQEGDRAQAGQLTGDLSTLAVRELSARPLLKTGEDQSVTCLVQNIGGISRRYVIPVMADGRPMGIDTVLLEPGEQRTVSFRWKAAEKGLQMISVKDTGERCKVFSDPGESLLLSLMLDSVGMDGSTPDGSGFDNRAMVVGGKSGGVTGGRGLLLGKGRYIVVPGAPSLDNMGETMTMAVWVYPAARSQGFVDIFTKGDNHVLQLKFGKTLSFFAGGWGRGDCTVDLPDDWVGHWHHLAGVCTGSTLLLYIDGRLAGRSIVDGVVNLSVTNKWVLGRNEEFPGERIFEGRIRDARVYSAALGEAEIRALAVAHQ